MRPGSGARQPQRSQTGVGGGSGGPAGAGRQSFRAPAGLPSPPRGLPVRPLPYCRLLGSRRTACGDAAASSCPQGPNGRDIPAARRGGEPPGPAGVRVGRPAALPEAARSGRSNREVLRGAFPEAGDRCGFGKGDAGSDAARVGEVGEPSAQGTAARPREKGQQSKFRARHRSGGKEALSPPGLSSQAREGEPAAGPAAPAGGVQPPAPSGSFVRGWREAK